MKGTLYQAACVAIPKGLGGALTILLNGLLIARMTPVEFGVYAICVTLVTLADAVLGSAIDMSSIKLASAYRPTDPARAVAIEQWAVAVKIAFACVALAALLPMALPLSRALFHREEPRLLALVLAVAAGVLLMRSISVHLQLRARFAAYAGLELLAQAARVLGIAAVLAWLSPSAMTLTLAALAGTVLALAAGIRLAGLRWQRIDLQWSAGRCFLNSLRWMFVTIALSALLARVDLLLVSQWANMEQVGIYAAAQVFAMVPELLGMWLAVVFSPRVLPAHHNGTLRILMRRVQAGLAGVGALVALGAWLILEAGRHWLPPGYAGSAPVLLPLMLGALSGMYALPITVPFVMFTRPGFIFAFDIITLPVLLLAYHWAITDHGAVGAAWVSAASRLTKAVTLQALAWLWSRPDLETTPNPSR